MAARDLGKLERMMGVLSFSDNLLVWLVVSVVGPAILLVCAILTRRVSTLLLRVSLRLAKRGLGEAGQAYLDEWVASWEHELREDLRRLGATGVGVELNFLARVVTLPLHLRSLREEAQKAALTEDSDVAPNREGGSGQTSMRMHTLRGSSFHAVSIRLRGDARVVVNVDRVPGGRQEVVNVLESVGGLPQSEHVLRIMNLLGRAALLVPHAGRHVRTG